jgi:hypothetical protein
VGEALAAEKLESIGRRSSMQSIHHTEYTPTRKLLSKFLYFTAKLEELTPNSSHIQSGVEQVSQDVKIEMSKTSLQIKYS